MVDPIRVTLNRNEYIRFNNYCYKNNYFYKGKSSSIPLVMFIIFIVVFVVALQLLNITLAQISMALLISLCLFLFIAARILQTFRCAIPDPDSLLFSEKQYYFDEQGIHETSEYGSSFIKWEKFKFIRTDGDLLYLFFDRVSTIIIPARCFVSTEESQQFVHMVKKHATNLLME
ncbi:MULTISPECIES: YcxB family protein [Providencia]|uniref:YcxB family protein n=2 Tax=Providencia TaxID=586 RepID=A0ABD5L603_PROST|nr:MULTISPECIES: YcxB family protein [Providencia]ELR5043698.1 YcxB family protein [Providencia rettgeri]ELR5291437.1 YcxB family protein [Providencia stuartii]MBG5919671.1 YcxB family protein [Providencia stuartii]MCR4180526.1 YcxB family protein [Providencia vermicola]QIC17192.1 YcxB family protein [Providencia vermicola]